MAKNFQNGRQMHRGNAMPYKKQFKAGGAGEGGGGGGPRQQGNNFNQMMFNGSQIPENPGYMDFNKPTPPLGGGGGGSGGGGGGGMGMSMGMGMGGNFLQQNAAAQQKKRNNKNKQKNKPMQGPPPQHVMSHQQMQQNNNGNWNKNKGMQHQGSNGGGGPNNRFNGGNGPRGGFNNVGGGGGGGGGVPNRGRRMMPQMGPGPGPRGVGPMPPMPPPHGFQPPIIPPMPPMGRGPMPPPMGGQPPPFMRRNGRGGPMRPLPPPMPPMIPPRMPLGLPPAAFNGVGKIKKPNTKLIKGKIVKGKGTIKTLRTLVNQYPIEKPWVTDAIRAEYEKKVDIENRLKGNKDDDLFAQFKVQRDKFVALYETAREEYLKEEAAAVKAKDAKDKQTINKTATKEDNKSTANSN